MFNKKALNDIVAVGLFLSITVLAFVGFQSWYQEFQTDKLVNTKEQSAVGGIASRIETVEGNFLYFNYKGSESNINYTQMKFGNVTCSTSGTLSNGINIINLTRCNTNLTSGAQDVSIITTKGIFTKKIDIEEGDVSVYVYDVIPNSFSFTNLSNQNISKLIESNTVILSGFDGPLTASISGDGNPEFSINGGSWTSSDININLSDNITLRLNSTVLSNGTQNATFTFGSIVKIWGVRTSYYCAAGNYSSYNHSIIFKDEYENVSAINETVNGQYACSADLYCYASGLSLSGESCGLYSCDTDYYNSSGSCVTVGNGYYSSNTSLLRSSCSGLPGNAYWSSSGGGIDNCSFTCNSGYHESGGSCVYTPTTCTAIGNYRVFGGSSLGISYNIGPFESTCQSICSTTVGARSYLFHQTGGGNNCECGSGLSVGGGGSAYYAGDCT